MQIDLVDAGFGKIAYHEISAVFPQLVDVVLARQTDDETEASFGSRLHTRHRVFDYDRPGACHTETVARDRENIRLRFALESELFRNEAVDDRGKKKGGAGLLKND